MVTFAYIMLAGSIEMLWGLIQKNLFRRELKLLYVNGTAEAQWIYSFSIPSYGCHHYNI